ncbi:class I SAM-dependent methyltransferase [Crossiella cryophila]|uniref:Ubiquinone/menaquinone biosynthesis C-methylase UbiE n=1 Tax=Crossiella cryophila TaxID=43355 RepID=A0A7W7C7K2_9PSEU|nr:class I SAM-dependent methyltransferase [Crossiella cryophila]MBB4675945.1 ubiquinone/menaquinone biosynthesis C-methylase UbiE [Crossiella cryophila]
MSSPTRQRLDSWLLGLDVKRYYSEMADRIAGLPDGPILEIPAGNGPLFKQAAGYRDRGPWIFADLSWHLLKQLAAKVEAVGAKRHLIIRADACALPIVDGTMAGAVSMFGIHCFHDKSAVFGELRRVVSEEGQIAVSTLTTDGHKLSQYYHQMSQKDGTFAPDNSWAEISTAARGQGLELHGTTGLGSARVFTARPKIHS